MASRKRKAEEAVQDEVAEGGVDAAPAAEAAEAELPAGQLASLQQRDEGDERRERTLPEFLELMDDYRPVIPDAVITYYLQRNGFDCDDVRIKRLIALAAQKFISDIAQDSMQYCKSRMTSTAAAAGKDRKGKGDKRLVLTMEDLSAALQEHGINASKPEYFT